MNKVFGYARVSTLDQNLDTQLDALQRAGCDEIFQDKITGMSTSRPALDELQAKLRSGDTVMTVGRCRCSLLPVRTQSNHLIQLISEFARKGIQFKALDLGVDSSTPAGKLVLQIFAALAEYDGTGHPAGKNFGEDAGGPVAGCGQRQTHRSSKRT